MLYTFNASGTQDLESDVSERGEVTRRPDANFKLAETPRFFEHTDGSVTLSYNG